MKKTNEEVNTWSDQNHGYFTDSRDGKTYKWVRLGEQIWLAENIRYTGDDIEHITRHDDWEDNYNGWTYYGYCEDFGDKYGVLYQWEAATKACPIGWHLPSDSEWTILENYLGQNAGSKLAGHAELWYNGKLDHSPEFNLAKFFALPGGLIAFFGFSYNLHSNGYWWTSTEKDSANAYGILMYYNSTSIEHYPQQKNFGYSVRCVKD